MGAKSSDLTAANALPGVGLKSMQGWRRDPRLWTAILCTLVLKLAMIRLQLGTYRPEWLQSIHTLMRTWRDFASGVRSGGVPYVDVECDVPALAASLRWLIAQLPSLLHFHAGRPTVAASAGVMALVDLVNVGLFFALAREAESRSPLRATLVFVASLTALCFGPTQLDGLVITCLLLAYKYRAEPRIAAIVSSLGAGLTGFFAWLFVAHELAHAVTTRDRRRWLQTLPVFAGVQLLLYAPYALAAYRAHGSFELQPSLLRVGPGAPSTAVELARLWLGDLFVLNWAPAVSAVLSVWAWFRTRNSGWLERTVVLAIAALTLYPTQTIAWQLWLYPLVLLIALRAPAEPRAWLLWLYAILDVATVLGAAFLLGPAREEFGEFEPGRALSNGAAWTLLWTLVVLLRLALLGALAQPLASGALMPVADAAPERLDWPKFDATRWTAVLRQPNLRFWLLAVFICAQMLIVSDATIGMRKYSDEVYHWPQIERFCKGDPKVDGALTTLPGYHVVSAFIGTLRDDCSRAAMRKLNGWWGLCTTFFAFLIVSALGSRQIASRTLSYYYLPFLFPYYFIVYTDVLALVPLLLALYLMLHRRWAVAGLVGAVSISIRQTNALVLVLLGLVALFEEDKARPFWQWAWSYLKKTWTSALGLIGFLVFVYKNDGVAMGDRTAHEAGLHFGNVAFLLALVAVSALPVNLERIWRERRALARAGFAVALLVLYLTYIYLFRLEHPYNTHVKFLRNNLLMWVTPNPLTKTLFFLPVAIGFAALWVTPLTRPAYWAWVPMALVMLLPESLIEQRYAILPISIWMLTRRDGSATAETLTAVTNMGLAIWLVRMLTTGAGL
jgi:alpha-1,2-glucosyltransferase